MDNWEIARTLLLTADVLEIGGANPFKVRAYRSGARTIEGLTVSLAEQVEAGTFGKEKIPGIGGGLQGGITELVRTGHLALLEEALTDLPDGLLDLLDVPGLGPKRIRRLREELEIEGLETLRAACEAGRVAALSGFGAKSEAKILSGLDFLRQSAGRVRLGDALPLAESMLVAIENSPVVIRSSLAGSLRRGRETVGDIDFVVSSEQPEEVAELFVGLDPVADVLARGVTKTTVQLSIGLTADLRVVADDVFPTTLAHFTGSKEHNVALRRIAKERGCKISEYGVYEGDSLQKIEDESALYRFFGLDPIPPELREGGDEIDAAREGGLPVLIEASDLVGVLHVHSTWSDGRQSIEEMALAARDRGYRYLGISDHSRAAAYAGGLDIDRLRAQREEIDELRSRDLGIEILAGSEVDILPDGQMDFPDEVLGELDFVIASIHSSFGQDRETMTGRICGALENPHVDILAHPTGRLLLSREPYAVDLERVIETAAQTGTILEINANPARLDLDAVWARRAREAGVRLLIGPDAHHTDGFDVMRYGLSTARRAWLTAGEVINCLEVSDLQMQFERGGDP